MFFRTFSRKISESENSRIESQDAVHPKMKREDELERVMIMLLLTFF
jgi:hypothetical protein